MSAPRRSRIGRELGVIVLVALVGSGLALWWTAPKTLFSSDHVVPRLLDLDGAAAERSIANLGFRPKNGGTRLHPSAPRGRVVAQDPPPGVVLGAGATVEIVTSGGPGPRIVPDLAGFALPLALKVLAAGGLEGATVDSAPNGADQPGVVVATRPVAGTTEDAGSTVGLVVSTAEVRP